MSKPHASPLSPNDEQIEQAIRIARDHTWQHRKQEFEHDGPVSTNPIFRPDRFNSFCADWGVGRTIRKGTHEEFRCLLRDSDEFRDALEDRSGNKLASLEKSLRPKFGAERITAASGKKVISSLISALSKVATFVRPETFVAWDKWARRGLNAVLGYRTGREFDTYADYLADFETVWTGDVGQRVRELTNQAAMNPTEREPRFQRRVLDLYLMTKGGHDHEPAKQKQQSMSR